MRYPQIGTAMETIGKVLGPRYPSRTLFTLYLGAPVVKPENPETRRCYWGNKTEPYKKLQCCHMSETS